MKKYEILKNDSMLVYENLTLYKIKALKNFGNVKKGDLGGRIEKEENLSQEGDCWVCENAKVSGNIRVCENVKVCGDIFICGDMEIFKNGKVFGDAKVYKEKEIENKTGKKDDKGKNRMDLIPPEILEELGKVLTYGANKYGEDENWKLITKNRFEAALQRHYVNYKKGNKFDNESGLLHLSHLLANAAFLVWKEVKNGNK